MELESQVDGLVTFSFVLQPVQEPEKMTQIIIQALESTKQRGIINEGWGGLGKCKCPVLIWLHFDKRCGLHD